MKNLTQGMKDHLASAVSSLATCWKLTRTDGVIQGFTSHDADLVFDTVTYIAATGLTPTATAESVGLKVDNLEVQSILDSANITDSDLEAGLYDFAKIEIFQLDVNDFTIGSNVLKVGTLGNVKIGREGFIAEVRGLSQKYTNTITSEYTPLCRTELGSTKCGIDLAALTVSATVTAVIDEHTFETNLTAADGYFEYGAITFTAGLNASYRMEVKEYLNANGRIKMFLKLPGLVQVGDTFNVFPGCNKTFSVCKAKFNNVINFRGEPSVPGQDRLVTGK